LNKNLEVREKTMARLLADGKTYIVSIRIEAREGKKMKKIFLGWKPFWFH
jgi:hypothetical protein